MLRRDCLKALLAVPLIGLPKKHKGKLIKIYQPHRDKKGYSPSLVYYSGDQPLLAGQALCWKDDSHQEVILARPYCGIAAEQI